MLFGRWCCLRAAVEQRPASLDSRWCSRSGGHTCHPYHRTHIAFPHASLGHLETQISTAASHRKRILSSLQHHSAKNRGANLDAKQRQAVFGQCRIDGHVGGPSFSPQAPFPTNVSCNPCPPDKATSTLPPSPAPAHPSPMYHPVPRTPTPQPHEASSTHPCAQGTATHPNQL